jgi:predicted ATPase
MTPERRTQRTIALRADVLYRRAAHQPVLFVLEDLHWIDPTTAELVELLVDRAPDARILIVLSTRPGADLAVASRGDVVRLALSRLTMAQVRHIAERVSGDRRLPEAVLREIVARTDGVPLYIEELTRMVVESGQLALEGNRYVLKGALERLAIPATLQDSLTARLDRLAVEKPVAQLAACIGREFGFDLLAAASSSEAHRLPEKLAALVDAQLVYQRGVPPDARYIFKHALIQDAAYGSMLTSARRANHGRIASALEAGFPDVVAAQPEVRAHHLTEAGRAPLSGRAAMTYMSSVAGTIAGGTSEVQRNVIATRGLGLPRA